MVVLIEGLLFELLLAQLYNLIVDLGDDLPVFPLQELLLLQLLQVFLLDGAILLRVTCRVVVLLEPTLNLICVQLRPVRVFRCVLLALVQQLKPILGILGVPLFLDRNELVVGFIRYDRYF